MEILHDPKIDFMKFRRIWITVSVLTILAGLVGIFFMDRLNFGVDFSGGTQLVLKFKQAPEVDELRSLIAGAGFRESVIQRFGERAADEVLIRTPIIGDSEEGSAAQVLRALNGRYNPGATGGIDLNQAGAPTLADFLAAGNPDGVATEQAPAYYEAIAQSVLKKRKDTGLFTDFSEIQDTAGLTPKALDYLRSNARMGNFSVQSNENVSAPVGKELRRRGFLAVVGAIIGMLIYIALRFELRFGIGATMATLHDVLITVGLFAWAGFEFNLTTVAAFLTLIGYSVNDTVVTFDRVRENLRRSRSTPMVELLNRSINQTLSRTILTGGTTILASGCLLIFGGDVIRGFAFVMTIGVVVGTYSSIYIASPFALLWEEWFGPGGRFRKKAPAAAGRRRTAPAR
jgi:preprotein translocase subunit SecF